MKETHHTQNSWYMNKTLLSPILGEVEQTQAFAELAAAQVALRTHLHGCSEVASHILSKARAAASGRQGSKNEAKKFFHAGGPTENKLRDCTHPANQESLSTALHALGGKQALYSECAGLARNARVEKESLTPQAREGSTETYHAQLKALESAYIRKRNLLVTRNLRLVAAVIKKLRLQSMDWEDLMQSGAISLQKAVETFDASKGVKFSTYAVPVIKGDLIRAMENFSHEVRIPNHLWVKIRQYNRTLEELSLDLGRTPSHVEVALELGIPVQEAARLEQYQWDPVSLDAPHGHSGEGMSLGDFLMDHNAQIPGEEWSAHHECGAPHSDALELMEPSVFPKDAGDGGSPRREAA
jgi:DNA-directed RNA polymerase sigma subunit (sigma70/sigma32)